MTRIDAGVLAKAARLKYILQFGVGLEARRAPPPSGSGRIALPSAQPLRSDDLESIPQKLLDAICDR